MSEVERLRSVRAHLVCLLDRSLVMDVTEEGFDLTRPAAVLECVTDEDGHAYTITITEDR